MLQRQERVATLEYYPYNVYYLFSNGLVDVCACRGFYSAQTTVFLHKNPGKLNMFKSKVQPALSKSRPFTIIIMLSFPLVLLASLAIGEPDINSEMKVMHEAMQYLFPIAVEKKKLNDAEAQKVTENVKSLYSHITHINPDFNDKSDTFIISYQSLLTQLEQTQKALDHEEYPYALSLISEIPQQCAFCHTQDEQFRNFDSSEIKKKLNSDFLRGEYHFMIRDYNQALLDYHDHLIKQRRIEHGKGNSEALEKILLIYVQVFQDLGNAEMYFNRLLESGKLQPGVAIDINLWLTDLSQIKYRYTRHSKMDIATLESFAESVLHFSQDEQAPTFVNEKDKASALWLRGMLYEFMSQNPQHPDTPKVLYWLASLESSLNYGINYQLPEIYLKHCVEKYSNHAYAQKCYDQYDLLINFQYTGSGGTHLPVYKQNDLDSLKNKLSKAK